MLHTTDNFCLLCQKTKFYFGYEVNNRSVEVEFIVTVLIWYQLFYFRVGSSDFISEISSTSTLAGIAQSV